MTTADAQSLRFLDRALVLQSGRPVARLVREPAAVRFEYLPEHLADPAARAVATTLPLSDDPVHSGAAGAVPAFFAGLLPEGRRLSALRRAVKTSADDDLTLLLAVGADTVGDVQVVPLAGVSADGDMPAPREALVVDDWSDVRFAHLYAELTGEQLPPKPSGVAGVQVKASTQMISLPVARAHERYLLKLDPPEYPHLVANEAFFLDAARASGLDAATAQVVRDADGREGLLVRRFDRVAAPGGDGFSMLALEDGCQVLGRYPADKYTLAAELVVTGLAAVTDAPVVAARELVRQLAFAYLIGNGDAHAKNLSVLCHPSDEWRVSPLYDAPSSYRYGDTTMALPINDKTDDRIGLDDFVALGEAAGVRARATKRVIAELIDRVDVWLPRLGELPFDQRTLHELSRVVEYRRDRLRPAAG